MNAQLPAPPRLEQAAGDGDEHLVLIDFPSLEANLDAPEGHAVFMLAHVLPVSVLEMGLTQLTELLNRRDAEFVVIGDELAWRERTSGDLVMNRELLAALNDAVEQQTSLTLRPERAWDWDGPREPVQPTR